MPRDDSKPSDLQTRIAALARITPLHHLPKRERARFGACVVRGGGRPKKIEVVPTADGQDYNAAIDQQREVWIQADPIVRTQQDPTAEPIKRVREIELGIAQEAASLLWERRRIERAGGDAAQVVSRRTDALGKLALTVLGRAKFFEPELDPEGPRMKRVLGLWLAAVGEVANATLPSETAAVVMARLAEALVTKLDT